MRTRIRRWVLWSLVGVVLVLLVVLVAPSSLLELFSSIVTYSTLESSAVLPMLYI